MKNKKILLTLALSLLLAACGNTPAKNPVSEETITAALDNDTEALKDNDEVTNSETENESEITDPNAIDHDKWRDMIVEIGEFSELIPDSLSDKDIDDLVEYGTNLAEQTGYWDVKDFVFQELGKIYPELSYKFPLDSIAAKYDDVPAEGDEISGKYDYERRLIIDNGYPSQEVWAFTDKEIEDAFHKAYAMDEEGYYEDYVEMVGEILFDEELTAEADEVDEEITADEEETDEEETTTKKQQLRRFGSNQIDYDALKSALVQYYEFSPSVVNQITNEDIDIAYTRAMDRLEETGFGDIGLIFEELGKMYPGSSEMYPGE